MAVSQQESLAQRYAPRPDFLPVGSSMTCPSGVRTTRNNSRLGLVSRQATQVRRGMCFGRFGCLFPLVAMAIPYPHHIPGMYYACPLPLRDDVVSLGRDLHDHCGHYGLHGHRDRAVLYVEELVRVDYPDVLHIFPIRRVWLHLRAS